MFYMFIIGCTYIQKTFPLLLFFTGTTARIFKDRSLYYCVLQVRPLVYLEIVPFIIVFTGTATRIFRDRSLYYCVLQVRSLVYLEIVPFIIVFYRYDRSQIQRSSPLLLYFTGTTARIFRDRPLYYCILQVRPLVYLEIVPFIIVFYRYDRSYIWSYRTELQQRILHGQLLHVVQYRRNEL